MFLKAATIARDFGAIRAERPALWRAIRRFNRPVQLAVAAAMELLETGDDAATVSLISLAPCCAGSPELLDWARKVNARRDRTAPIRANPTHGLHAVDNLALSAVAMMVGSRGRGVGLGGSAGQAWEALEIACEQQSEVVVFAGDQACSARGGDEIGVALRLSPSPDPGDDELREIRHDGEETGADAVVPHAAAGLAALISAVREAAPGPLSYRVPSAHGDGLEVITLELEVG